MASGLGNSNDSRVDDDLFLGSEQIKKRKTMNGEKINDSNKWRCAEPCSQSNYFENTECLACGRDRPEDTAKILIREAAKLMRNSGEAQAGANMRQAFLHRVERHLEGGYESLADENERLVKLGGELEAKIEQLEEDYLALDLKFAETDASQMFGVRVMSMEIKQLKAENLHETAKSEQLAAEIEQLKSDSEWLLAARETKL
jgi:hypothetical protein